MCLSRDSRCLITGDSNGILCMSEFESEQEHAPKEKDGGGKGGGLGMGGMGGMGFDFVDEVLIHQSDLDNRKGQVRDLTQTHIWCRN
jgi:hypothetical protein